ncbi:MAG: methyltransferase domain-containing protein [Chloroflexi bacterium]|nr:MAG: methyltransferase domain-containing protein [Chloroflexota bacterium]
MIVLSHLQASQILAAHKNGQSVVKVSLDLNLTENEVRLQPEAVLFPTGESLDWASLAEISDNEIACYTVEDHAAKAIKGFSEFSGRVYGLMPTASAPTMLISGIPMHRIKDTNPHRDTLNKIKAIAPLRGDVLDTTTGLGYTAIEAAKTARRVVTIEIDPMAQEIARLNPWSQALFEDPKITQVIGDAFEEIEKFEAESFSAILHDPPMFSLAGDLYSRAFYQQAFRVLKHNGKMFHYIGDPESKSGARVTAGVIRRLQEAGFKRMRRAPRAFGVVAHKE